YKINVYGRKEGDTQGQVLETKSLRKVQSNPTVGHLKDKGHVILILFFDKIPNLVMDCDHQPGWNIIQGRQEIYRYQKDVKIVYGRILDNPIDATIHKKTSYILCQQRIRNAGSR